MGSSGIGSRQDTHLTAAQRDVWLGHQACDDARYTIAWATELTGAVDISRLVASVTTVVDAAEAVHVQIVDTAGEPRQQPVRRPWAVGIVDLRDADDPGAAARAWMDDDADRRFDPTAETLFRHAVLRVTDECSLWYQCWHHLVADGYSATTVAAAVADHYARGVAPDAAAWTLDGVCRDDRDHRDSEDERLDEKYWRTVAAALPDAPRPMLPRAVGRPITALSFTRDRAWVARAAAVAADANVGLSRVLLAAIGAYVARTDDSTAVTVGLAVSGRGESPSSTAPSMRSTVHPLPIRAGRTSSLMASAQELAASLRDARPHRRFRGERLGRAGGVGVNLMMRGHAPDFGHGVRAEVRNVRLGPVSDLEFVVYGDLPDGALRVELRGRGPVREHATRLSDFLDRALAAPGAPLATLGTLSTDEARTVLLDWNDTDEPARSVTVPALLDEQFRRREGAVAIVDGDRRVTYGELDRRSRSLAAHLRDRGVESESVVAIGLERSAEMVVAIVAVLRAGGAFVPLDPHWPAERRDSVLLDAGARLVITEPGGLDAGDRAVPVDLSAWSYPEAVDADGEVGAPTIGASLAYVIFTSGSTGRPKGAMIRHEAICARLEWQRDRILGFGEDDASLFKAPLSFDISVNEILLPLVSGGRVVVARPGGERDPHYLLDLVARESVTFAYLVSSMLSVLLELAEGTGRLSPLRHVWCGGEVLTPDLFDRFRTQLGTTLYHGYGPAEATIGVSHVVYRGDAERIATSIGRPNPNTRLYVMDSSVQPLPAGRTGELYAGGFLLGRGYVGAPALTASRFVADPHRRGERLYRTGDLVRWTADGALDFVGRADNQVKIRGMRLELEEVEAAMTTVADVRAAVVTVRRTPAGADALVAHVCVHSASPTVEAADRIRRSAADVLPDYMVPSAVVVLDELPLTANSKVDRRALPEPDWGGIGAGVAAGGAPRTDAESRACAAFADVLGGREVGVDADFFECGGDSIVAVSLVAAAARHGFIIGVGDVFRGRTPAGLAAAAEQRKRIGLASAMRERPTVTPLQSGLYFHTLRTGESVDPYTVQQLVVLDGDVDAERLHRAVDAVTARHDALRTGYEIATDGSVVGRVSTSADAPWRVVGSSAVGESDRHDVVTEVARAERAVGFDLACPPLLRHCLVRFDRTHSVLVRTSHHIATDGWSLTTVLGDVLSAYEGTPASTPVQFGAVLDRLSKLDTAAGLASWTRALTGVTTPTLVADGGGRASSPDETLSGADPFDHGRIDVSLSAAESEALRTAVRGIGTTTAAALHVAWAVALGRAGRTTDVVFGTTTSGRGMDVPGIDTVVGLVIDTVPTRVSFHAGTTLASALRRWQDHRTEVIDADHVGLAEIHRALGVSELFDSVLVVENYPERPRGDGELRIGGLHAIEASHYPITVMAQLGDRLTLQVKFDRTAVSTALAEALAATVRAVLVEAARSLETTMAALPLAGARIRPTEVVPADDVVVAIGRRVREDLGAVALDVGSRTTTYDELERWSQRTAAVLAASGVAPGDVVALALDRSAESVVAMLAVLRCGAAYLPIDLDYPMDRIRYVIGDANPSVAVVDERGHRLLADVAPHLRTVTVSPRQDAGVSAAGAPPIDLAPDLPAYLVYTSGSTGLPKGVVGTRGALAQRIRWGLDRSTPGGARLAKSSFAFIDGSTELLVGLAAGARVVVAGGADIRDGQRLSQAIRRHRPTDVVMVPSLLGALADADPDVLSLVPRWICSGEQLDAGAVHAWTAAAPGVRIDNSYGSSEVAGDVIVGQTSGGVAGTGAALGSVVPGSSVALLDDFLRPVLPGLVGELYVGGAQVARGYHGRAALTAERFVAAADGSRWYRTGDLAVVDASGVYRFVGRTDAQLSVRGHRIEPAEIEAALALCPALVTSAATVVDGRVVAVVVLDPAQGDVTDDSIVAVAASVLTDAAVPDRLVRVESLPCTPTGKLDRRAATDLAAAAPADSVDAVVPARTESERTLCGVVSEVVGVDIRAVSADADFFRIGGDSISSIRVVARAAARGVRITVADVFALRRLDRLAAHADSRQATADATIAHDEGPVPLSLTAARALAAGDDPTTALDSVRIDTDSPVTTADVERALGALIARHDALCLAVDTSRRRLWRSTVRSAVPVLVFDGPEATAGARGAVSVDPADTERAPIVAAILDSTNLELVGHEFAVDRRSLLALGASLRSVLAGADPGAPTRVGPELDAEIAAAATLDPDTLDAVVALADPVSPTDVDRTEVSDEDRLVAFVDAARADGLAGVEIELPARPDAPIGPFARRVPLVLSAGASESEVRHAIRRAMAHGAEFEQVRFRTRAGTALRDIDRTGPVYREL